MFVATRWGVRVPAAEADATHPDGADASVLDTHEFMWKCMCCGKVTNDGMLREEDMLYAGFCKNDLMHYWRYKRARRNLRVHVCLKLLAVKVVVDIMRQRYNDAKFRPGGSGADACIKRVSEMAESMRGAKMPRCSREYE